MADHFRADCEDLLDLANGPMRQVSEDVMETAKTLARLTTDVGSWGTGPLGAVQIFRVYEGVRMTFQLIQEDIAKNLDDVAFALRAIATNYLHVDEEIS